ncbi:MAG: DHA2 family efflux MFS transporter permease subunit [Alphaproteobacteria bacterium]|nr:DHA2 family efflux MFS transporter permease subunit [Alphaproteobacteria bacterium]
MTQVVPLRTGIAVMGGSLASFMAVLDVQIVNAALADIRNAVAAGPSDGSWITTSYLVGEIVVIPLTGWLSRVFSTRLYMIANAMLFVTFSLACPQARSLEQMIALRVLQGFTGGVMIPMALTLIITLLPVPRQPTGLALFFITATTAPAIGPSIGGWLTNLWGWQAIFYVTLGPGLVMIAMLWVSLDREPIRLGLLSNGDWWGVLTMALGLGCLQVMLEEGDRLDWLESTMIARLAAIAAVSLALFVWIELRVKEPLINLRLLAQRNFGIGSVAMFLLGVAVYGCVFILPLYLARVRDYNAAQIGHVLLWTALPQFVVLPFLPVLLKKCDPRWLVALGFALFAVSNLMIIALTRDVADAELLLPDVVRAVGQALVLTPLGVLAVDGIAPPDVPSASSLLTIMRNLGGAVGIASLQTYLDRREHLHVERLAETVSIFDENTRYRLELLAQYFTDHGTADHGVAWREAMLAVAHGIQVEASVMAFGDAFYVLGAAMLLGLALTALYRRPTATTGALRGH